MNLRESATGRIRCAELGEDRLLDQLLPNLPRNRAVLLGAGDDCAVVRSGQRGKLQLLKTDCLVENIHFTKKDRPELVGWKAMARPLSDFAAMSGVPEFALVTLIVPSQTTLAWKELVSRHRKGRAHVSSCGGRRRDKQHQGPGSYFGHRHRLGGEGAMGQPGGR